MTADLIALAAKVEASTGPDNSLDVAVEIALFEPDRFWSAVRANKAGTKIICTRTSDGAEITWRAGDHTKSKVSRKASAAALRSRAEQSA